MTVDGVTGGLVVFCGLPGVGKSSVSRRVADRLGATYLRIDTIEAAIVSTLIPFEGNPVGYVVAGRVAADQLRAGRSVVADAVNGVTDARRGWESVAQECGVPIRFVVVTCSANGRSRPSPTRHGNGGLAPVSDATGTSTRSPRGWCA